MRPPSPLPRVLYVDDDANQRLVVKRVAGSRFDTALAPDASAGLELLATDGPFSVVISDLQMPRMSGIEFLKLVRERAPDAVRILLTGQANLDAAIAAVNEGQIFRFLTKPCAAPVLVGALEAAAKQHRLVTAERILLEETLRGSIKMLTDVLALANPMAFGRAIRVKGYASELGKAAGIEAIWQIEVSAMLSQIGCITLPSATIDKMHRGQPLSEGEQVAADRLPAIAEALLANIPRLEEIRACLRHQAKRFDGAGQPPSEPRGEAIPVGARVLKIALDYDVLEARGNLAPAALATLRGRVGWYDPSLLRKFASLRETIGHALVREIPLPEVVVGMIFAEDVKTEKGVLVISRGHEVTEGLVERIRNFPVKGHVRVSIRPV